MSRANKVLLHELAGYIQKTTEPTRATAPTGSAASIALQIKLESHLSSLGNGVLLCSTRILNLSADNTMQ